LRRSGRAIDTRRTGPSRSTRSALMRASIRLRCRQIGWNEGAAEEPRLRLAE
jgi:hypothetical protein